MNWTMVLEIVSCIGGVATLLALMLGPMFYLGAKMENIRSEIRNDMKAMHKEIHEEMRGFRAELKDYHSRLLVLEDRYLRLREKE